MLYIKQTVVDLVTTKHKRMLPHCKTTVTAQLYRGQDFYINVQVLWGNVVAVSRPFTQMSAYYHIQVHIQDSECLLNLHNQSQNEEAFKPNTLVTFSNVRFEHGILRYMQHTGNN